MASTYPEWKRLQDLLGIVKTDGFRRLDAAEIIEFGKLYRRAAAELSFHRTHNIDPARVAFLNDLVGQCYPHVYAAPRRPWPSIRRFFAADFPRAVRRHILFVLLAVLITMIPAAIGYQLTRHKDRALADQVLPEGSLMGLDEQIRRHHVNDNDWMPEETRPYTSAFIMTNNIKVSILAFGGGMTAGVLTIILLISNGVMLGTCAGAVASDGGVTATNFWAFVAPHGVLELTAIFISAAAGLVMAYAMVNPGEVPRRVALKRAGKEALKLMLGVATMLVIAGLIEGFFSPIPPVAVPARMKFTAAAVEAVLMVAYFAFAGLRSKDEAETPYGDLLAPAPHV